MLQAKVFFFDFPIKIYWFKFLLKGRRMPDARNSWICERKKCLQIHKYSKKKVQNVVSHTHNFSHEVSVTSKSSICYLKNKRRQLKKMHKHTVKRANETNPCSFPGSISFFTRKLLQQNKSDYYYKYA